MEIEEPASKKPERKNTPLWIGFSISGIWLLAFAIYGYRNFVELISLASNNLGDFIAGVFAPLAFLWLFVATLLQRQELELQRQELAETRAVMALQKDELKRAADENREQTEILKKNFELATQQLEYDRVDTLLFGTAIFIRANCFSLRVQIGGNAVHLVHSDLLYKLEVDKANFDTVYILIHPVLIDAQRRLNERSVVAFATAFEDRLFLELSSRFELIRKARTDAGPLVHLRLSGLNFKELDAALEKIKNAVAR